MQQSSRSDLKVRWRGVFRTDPPSRASREFMLGHIIWQEQASQHGGLGRKTSRQLKLLKQQLRDGKNLTPQHTLVVKSGTRLLREYKGQSHEVVAEENGFLYRGKHYGSLSKIAREITDTRWNGKLFFGVTR